MTAWMRVMMLACVALASPAQDAARAEREIRAVMAQQEADWNRGDIEAFMKGYLNSPATLFVGSSVTRGWQATLDNYRRRYSSRAQMGQLTFTIREVRFLGREHAFVLGEFRLARSPEGGGEARGKFTLTWAHTKEGWKIETDHTSN